MKISVFKVGLYTVIGSFLLMFFHNKIMEREYEKMNESNNEEKLFNNINGGDFMSSDDKINHIGVGGDYNLNNNGGDYNNHNGGDYSEFRHSGGNEPHNSEKMQGDNNHNNVIRILPPLITTKAILDHGLSILEEVFGNL